MNSIPAIFILDFGTAIFKHHSVAFLTLSHLPLLIKRKKQKTFEVFRTSEILLLFHFAFTIEILHFKFLPVSHALFLS